MAAAAGAAKPAAPQCLQKWESGSLSAPQRAHVRWPAAGRGPAGARAGGSAAVGMTTAAAAGSALAEPHELQNCASEELSTLHREHVQ